MMKNTESAFFSFSQSFPPSVSPGARLLILGSMPGVESLRKQEYYAFSHNVFWRIMGEIFSFSRELPYETRLALLRENRVALWDTLRNCERRGSLDSDIRNPVPNDIAGLLKRYPTIVRIICNGTAAWNFLRRYHPDIRETASFGILRLPSTSPAAASIPYGRKCALYRNAVLEVCR